MILFIALCYSHLVHGNWTIDSIFSACSRTCGEGIRQKVIHCNNPSPAYGGLNCSCEDDSIISFCNGLRKEIQESCYEKECPGKKSKLFAAPNNVIIFLIFQNGS